MSSKNGTTDAHSKVFGGLFLDSVRTFTLTTQTNLQWQFLLHCPAVVKRTEISVSIWCLLVNAKNFVQYQSNLYSINT